MFFDDLEESRFGEAVREYAVLLNRSFTDWYITEELLDAQQALEEERVRAGMPEGSYWWRIPPIDILNHIAENYLDTGAEEGEWRYERHFAILREGDTGIGAMQEWGHKTVFTSRKERWSRNVSPYTEAEIRDAIKKHNEKLEQQDRDLLLCTPYNVGIQSLETGMSYRSAFEYVTSAERQMDHIFAETDVRSKMENIIETRRTYASSQSLDYTAGFVLADLTFSAKTVTGMVLHPYLLAFAKGLFPFEEKPIDTEPVVMLADTLRNDGYRVRDGLFAVEERSRTGAAAFARAVMVAMLYDLA